MSVSRFAGSEHSPEDRRLILIPELLAERCTVSAPEGCPRFTLFLSASDGTQRATVVHASGDTPGDAWRALLEKGDARNLLRRRWLRVDWPETVEALDWKALRARLQQTKRNYFRQGIALDAGFERAFLELELNGSAMLYGGGSVFIDAENRVHDMIGAGLDAGHRRIGELTPDVMRAAIDTASQYLARQVQADGSFVYGYHPCFDRTIDAYNTLRHASTVYAMTEAWELTGDDDLKAAIDRSLDCLTERFIKTTPLPGGGEAAFLVDVGDEIKLGGNAVSILALSKYTEVTGDRRYMALLDKLACGIAHMQNPETGRFTHVLDYPSLSVRQPFRIIYYEGEAAFALMRLYGLTGNGRWLVIVEKAFDHFIAARHWRHHDHWLGYCANELTKYSPDERYFRFGIANIEGYLDFIRTRITTFPTLLELSMAAQQMLMRIAETPHMQHLFRDIDLERFRDALDFRAGYLLNGYFWPEMAMYFRSPAKIAGSFFIRHHAFRVRIDDVEHNLSGFVAYRNFLDRREAFDRLVDSGIGRQPASAAPVWTAEDIAAATGGVWVRQPPEGWTAAGLSTFAPAMQPGHLAVVRAGEEKVGMLAAVARRMRPPPAGIVTADAGAFADQAQAGPAVPVLQVAGGGDAVLAMGRYARARMTGRVIAVTGIAGKTTAVAMLTHALSVWGPARGSVHNANLPHGVGWNLASIPWDTPHVVLELAVGRMGVSARMARPHVAVFTNVLPAHLEPASTLSDIARTKSAIFLGMSPGDTAIVNREMCEWETVHAAARQRAVRVLHYGTGEDCDFRLVGYDARERRVTARIEGREVVYRIGAAGRHMALNSLAVLAAVAALGHPLEPAIAQLGTFSALPGRGAEMSLTLGAPRLTVIDDSYNANRGSMTAALDRLGELEGPGRAGKGRRVAVLGQMAELGPDAARYHTDLAAVIERNAVDRVYVTGELYADLWQALPPSRRGRHVDSLAAMKDVLQEELAERVTPCCSRARTARASTSSSPGSGRTGGARDACRRAGAELERRPPVRRTDIVAESAGPSSGHSAARRSQGPRSSAGRGPAADRPRRTGGSSGTNSVHL